MPGLARFLGGTPGGAESTEELWNHDETFPERNQGKREELWRARAGE